MRTGIFYRIPKVPVPTRVKHSFWGRERKTKTFCQHFLHTKFSCLVLYIYIYINFSFGQIIEQVFWYFEHNLWCKNWIELGTRAQAQEQKQDPTGVPRANFLLTAKLGKRKSQTVQTKTFLLLHSTSFPHTKFV